MTVRTARLRAIAPVVALAAMLAVGACGGSDDGGVASAGGGDTAADDPAEDEAGPDDQGIAFAECARENGVDMPDPVGENGLIEALQSVRAEYDQETLREALEACQDLLPVQPGESGDRPELDEETQLELAECLRDHGLDVPDNLFEQGLPDDIDRDDLLGAMDECRDFAPEVGQ
jgi:hypothetical protein